MNGDIEAIENNEIWDLLNFPTWNNNIEFKWFYKTKYNEKGKFEKHKARLVAKGFGQQPGIDYGDTFVPVARLYTIRTMLAIAIQKHCLVYQLDVKSTFSNGTLKEEVYID